MGTERAVVEQRAARITNGGGSIQVLRRRGKIGTTFVVTSSPENAGFSERGRRAHDLFLEAQDEITRALENADGSGRFTTDAWTREGGGGGRTAILAEGSVIEKGGVGVSAVFGELSDAFAKELPGTGKRFFAAGISLVIHPRSPHVPTVHANFRYLEKGEGAEATAWFGGGSDLTPWILYEEDAIHFHRSWKQVCDRHPVADYAAFKRACDEYFYLPHREERRGIGGIFFDYLGLDDKERGGRRADLEEVHRFVKEAAKSFIEAYVPILERRKGAPYTESERNWQLIRRGRYVEFNLVYDRGTVFGLKTKGRTESILMSLPALVRWEYDHRPAPGTYQQALVDVLRTPRDWLGLDPSRA
jgi:coproporphyrinogen III oxidase